MSVNTPSSKRPLQGRNRQGRRGGQGHSRPQGPFVNHRDQPAPSHNPLLKQPKPPLERIGLIEIAGKPATVLGRDVQVGQLAPSFTAQANDWSAVDVLSATAGKVRILASGPSLDTSVDDMETRKFEEAAATLGDDVEIAVITTDMPMTQKRWCANAGITRVTTYSDVLNTDFGVNYGCLIRERRYLRRAVFVVDRNDRIAYAAYMSKLGDEPNYDDVLRAAKLAVG